MVTDYQKIRNTIEEYLLIQLRGGKRDNQFIIYPFGEYGMLTKKILNESFGILERYIVDNKLSKYNSNIKSLGYFHNKDVSKYTILLTNANPDVYTEVRQMAVDIFGDQNILDIFPEEDKYATQCGKYSYGPLCKHWLVESVGAFCSFAAGADVVQNHALQYISTHPFLYHDEDCNEIYQEKYDDCQDSPWYFPGVQPQGKVPKLKRIRIGNDVWLGKNVIITNGSDIGNGVIAAAGAVITKNVPDYAVVAGIPARIIKYRFEPYQIQALNQIAWWNWTDEKIRKYYKDFFENIDEFIRRHENNQDEK